MAICPLYLSIRMEKRLNPFLRASDAEELGRLRLLKDEF